MWYMQSWNALTTADVVIFNILDTIKNIFIDETLSPASPCDPVLEKWWADFILLMLPGSAAFAYFQPPVVTSRTIGMTDQDVTAEATAANKQ